jgi:hypothetical protein
MPNLLLDYNKIVDVIYINLYCYSKLRIFPNYFIRSMHASEVRKIARSCEHKQHLRLLKAPRLCHDFICMNILT